MKNTTRSKQLLEMLLPWSALAVLLVFSYAMFVAAPYVGFEFSRGEITGVYWPSYTDSLQVGDRLLRVGSVEMADFNRNPRLGIFEGVHAGDVVPIVLDRDGQVIEVDWVIPRVNRALLLERFNGLWWLPYVFWLAGTVTLLFVRPKDSRWRLLIAFNYLTAIWLVAGLGPSHLHIWYSALILSSTVWLCLPVYLHLHWVFPRPFKRLPDFIWVCLYALGACLAVLEWFQVFSLESLYIAFIIELTGSVVLLVAHAILQKEIRRDIGLLAGAVALTTFPMFGVALAIALGLNPPGYITGGSVLALPALPGAYFLVTYRRQFGRLRERINRLTRIYFGIVVAGTTAIILLAMMTISGNQPGATSVLRIGIILVPAVCAITSLLPFLSLPAITGESLSIGRVPEEIEIRANSVLSLFLFVVLVVGVFGILIILADSLINFPGDTTFIALMSVFLVCGFTATGFPKFQQLVDRFVLNVKLRPDELLMVYSDRIGTSLDPKSLAGLLRDELIPSLLVRQSVLLRVDSGMVKPFMVVGVEDWQIPKGPDIPGLEDRAGKFLFPADEDSPSKSWIRLVLPLKVGGDPIGFWLFGRRDPDDYYSQSEIKHLEVIANQTAIALTNVDQARQLHTFYQSNIDWHEEERKALARELHDGVLSSIAELSLQTSLINSPEFYDNYARVTASIRGIITTLRPAMLDYGIWTALDEFIDGLSDQVQDGTVIRLEIPKSAVRYDPKMEEHLYRISQQACENAVRHAQANNIRVYGNLAPSLVNLVVEDDGIGLEFEQMDFSSLLEARHFGLAGMFERADLIGAEIRIDSDAETGTRVIVNWVPGEVQSGRDF
jgi:signal transduction histidine kinase